MEVLKEALLEAVLTVRRTEQDEKPGNAEFQAFHQRRRCLGSALTLTQLPSWSLAAPGALQRTRMSLSVRKYKKSEKCRQSEPASTYIYNMS